MAAELSDRYIQGRFLPDKVGVRALHSRQVGMIGATGSGKFVNIYVDLAAHVCRSPVSCCRSLTLHLCITLVASLASSMILLPSPPLPSL